jgi:peptidoglycan/xylan/chitin deacetylase (PgdA/CDA1 family)
MTAAPRPRAAGIDRALALGLALAGALIAAGCRPGGAPAAADLCRVFLCDHDGIVRADTSVRRMSLVFTGGSFAEGGDVIRRVLRDEGIKAAFFFTGDFYRAPAFEGLIRGLAADGHYLGAHSDKHLLYCPWDDHEKTLVSREEFRADLEANFREMERFGVRRDEARLFIPPYEWYNREIAAWSRELGLTLFNFTPGTSSNADYTTPSMPGYLSSQTIFDRILAYEQKDPHGLNGFILLIHVGTDPERTDKLYGRLADLIGVLKGRGYALVRLDELLRLPAR